MAAITLIPETRAKTFNTFNTNALGTLNFLMAAKAQDVSKIVYVSTCHVYGKQEKLPITEESAPKPIDIYSASKLAGEGLALSFADRGSLACGSDATRPAPWRALSCALRRP